jgi:hypothetical protein
MRLQTFNDVVEDIQAHAERFREEYDILSLKVSFNNLIGYVVFKIKHVQHLFE